ncbi:MAG: hypothetical protein ABIO74_04465 [Dokdonella sp.]
MTKSPAKPDSPAHRNALRTAWIVGLVAAAIYVGAILDVVLRQ